MKPVVHFRRVEGVEIKVGEPTFVVPLDHMNPIWGQAVRNGSVTRTSTVVSVASDGKSFETRNTLYVEQETP